MSMERAKQAVDTEPGQTAYWYGRNIYTGGLRMSYLYNDFYRAVKHGLIRSERNKHGNTVYFPV